MKVAVVGSRTLNVSKLGDYLPSGVTCIVSGGAVGIDSAARKYAEKNHIPIVEYLPQYTLYGRAAPIKRNIQIAENADVIIAFWDGKSRGTKFVIDYCVKHNKPLRIYLHTSNGNYTPYAV